MKNRKLSLSLGISVLILAILACTMNVGGPDYPAQSIPVSTEAAGEIQYVVETAVAAGAVSGQITLTLTEEQLTSYLVYKLQASAQPIFRDPQVYLQDGQIQLYATMRSGYFQATASIVLTASVDEQGQLKIELTSADLGPLPVPAGLNETITSLIQEAYTGAIGPAATGFKLENVTIADGAMTITGRTK